MNYPAASCEVSLAEFIDLIEASFEELDPTRLKALHAKMKRAEC
jgi:hypothetical protein